METLEDTLRATHDWAIDRIHTLCEISTYNVVDTLEDAHAIRSEFSEWLNPEIKDHDVYSLEFIGEDHDGNFIDQFQTKNSTEDQTVE